MKPLVLALLLVCITASVMPCCAFDGCADESAAAPLHPQKEQKGTCSPFFTCSSCATAVMITEYPRLYIQVQPAGKQDHIFLPGILGRYNGSFWQPPRLG